MINVLFVILGVHVTLILVVLTHYIPYAIQSRSGFVEVAKSLALMAVIPYVPALFIIAYRIDQFDEWWRNYMR